MKKCLSLTALGFVTAISMIHLGCEWSGGGGSGSFNTSQGAGINVNFSGVYDGNLSGGKAVSSTSKGNIIRLTISQTGNRITVVDNQGSRYEGSTGAPGLIADPGTDGTFPVGATVVESQIGFAGKDEVAQRDVEFVGVIHIVTVTDVKGNSTTTVSDSGSTNSSNSGKTSTTTDENLQEGTVSQTIDNGDTITETTIVTIGVEGEEGTFIVTETTVVKDKQTDAVISRTSTSRTVTVSTSGSSKGNTSSSGKSATTTTTFNLTEANTQWRLEGTWIEKGGVAAQVDALSPGGVGLVTTTTTEETTQ
jgi:hypothetical protein